MAVAAAAAVVVLLFFGNAGTDPSAPAAPVVVNACIDDDGTAYLPLYDGTCVQIYGDVASAKLTKDRAHVLVLLKDGTLYVTDPQQSQKTIVADNAVSMGAIQNTGFVYKDDQRIAHRVLFADFSNVKLGNDVSLKSAENTLNIVYAAGNGNIFTLAPTTSRALRVGGETDYACPCAISDNGQISVWVEEEADSTAAIYINDGDGSTRLGITKYWEDGVHVEFTKDQKLTVITVSSEDRMWIKAVGTEPVEVDLPNRITEVSVYTEKGKLRDADAEDVTSLYVTTQGQYRTALYRVSRTGVCERVLYEITECTVEGGRIFYIDKQSLYCGILNGSEITEQKKIAGEVNIFEVTPNGRYVYYIKDYTDVLAPYGSGTLYCYALGTGESVRVASEVACYCFDVGVWVYSWTYNMYSTDGATVFYFHDLERKLGPLDRSTLSSWTYGSDSPKRIATEVLVESAESGLSLYTVEKDSLMYMKYDFTDTDGSIHGNWMYYNGSESVKAASTDAGQIVYADWLSYDSY